MIVRFTDTCAVGLPPDIEQAWALLGLYKHATPIALADGTLVDGKRCNCPYDGHTQGMSNEDG